MGQGALSTPTRPHFCRACHACVQLSEESSDDSKGAKMYETSMRLLGLPVN